MDDELSLEDGKLKELRRTPNSESENLEYLPYL